MSLRDAALILKQSELFDDLHGALALVGVTLEAPAVDIAPAHVPAADPFEPGEQPDEPDWSVSDSDGWSEAELEAEDTADDKAERPSDGDRPDHGSRRDPNDRSDGGGHRDTGGGAGDRTAGGSVQASDPRPPGPGVIARVLKSEPEEEPHPGGHGPRSYTSIPLPGDVLREAGPKHSGFRLRTLPLTLQSMIRVPQRGHEPDIAIVVERLALAEPLTDVPMLTRLGQPAQVQVLCELGLRLGPYAEDTRLLINVLYRLYGAERMDLRWFEHSPALGCGSGPVWTWQHYETPHATAATLLVAQGVPDRRSDPEAVHEFAAGLATSGSAVCTVLLGPGPRVPRFRGYPQLLVED